MVAYVSTDGDINRKMVGSGWADVYVYDGKPFTRTAAYQAAARTRRRRAAAPGGTATATSTEPRSGQRSARDAPPTTARALNGRRATTVFDICARPASAATNPHGDALRD
ncbi:MAG: hypothetical protein JHC84_02155 [Solirubrobacteraceae bacterium]|nr:hypothetical protein [Solirubrobacteraceae bacterium]